MSSWMCLCPQGGMQCLKFRDCSIICVLRTQRPRRVPVSTDADSLRNSDTQAWHDKVRCTDSCQSSAAVGQQRGLCLYKFAGEAQQLAYGKEHHHAKRLQPRMPSTATTSKRNDATVFGPHRLSMTIHRITLHSCA